MGKNSNSRKTSKKTKNRRLYLIDSENVGATFANELIKLGEKDRVIIFESDKSAKVKVLFSEAKKLVKWNKFKTVHIKNSASNAMDFVLATVLGSIITKNKYKEYIIVSNDNGYNSIIEYWSSKGYKIYKQGNIVNVESK